jgi:hypothetical protein
MAFGHAQATVLAALMSSSRFFTITRRAAGFVCFAHAIAKKRQRSRFVSTNHRLMVAAGL